MRWLKKTYKSITPVTNGYLVTWENDTKRLMPHPVSIDKKAHTISFPPALLESKLNQIAQPLDVPFAFRNERYEALEDLKATTKPDMKGLQPQQIEALEHIKDLDVAALFMEMGTGKTHTATRWVLAKRDMEQHNALKGSGLDRGGKRSVKRLLVVCPCVLIETWKQHLEKECPKLEVMFVGSQSLSTECESTMNARVFLGGNPESQAG